MKVRVRTVGSELNVKGTYILDTYLEYSDNVYWINRKYQRKLVWTLEEKQSFIDTILHNYPVPLFLMAKYKLEGENKYRKDIIDGLQRLNAIFSFIENEFPIKGDDGNLYYFNVSALAGGDSLKSDGILPKNVFRLDYEICRKFLNYQLPITTTEVSDTEIEDIFIRINSKGRKLSAQDLRQAGAIGLFSDLVRKTACYIRGDITENDYVLLSKMPSLSLSNRKLKYDINIYDTFWLKNHILTEKNIRLSRDEEIIARIYSYMILGDSVSPSSNTLNNIYDINSERNKKLNAYIEEYGLLNMMDKFSKIYAIFNGIFDSMNTDFATWLFKDTDTKGKSKVFQTLFLTLYELKKDMFEIRDYNKVANALREIGNREFTEITNDEEWNTKVRNDSIRRIKSIIQPLMTKTVQPKISEEWKYKLEELLYAASGIEAQMYDFKLGLTNLQGGKRNSECISKIVKTLTAMVNTQPDKEATIIIGIANDKNSAKDFLEHYKTSWIEVAKCYITGIDQEIKKYWNGLEEYCDYVKNIIEKEPIEKEFSGQILREVKTISYENRTLLILTLKNNGKAIAYDERLYERHGSHNTEIKIGTPEFFELMKRTTK